MSLNSTLGPIPNRVSFPSRLPGASVDSHRGGLGKRSRFGQVVGNETNGEQHRHDGENGPALAHVFGGAAEGEHQRGRDEKDKKTLEEVRERRRILNGCAELALKNPPPLVPSILMASWLARGPMGIDWVPPTRPWFERRAEDSGSLLGK